MIREAIAEDLKLSKMNILVKAKGSFKNRTNIPSDSDVDVAVIAQDYYFNDIPEGRTHSEFGFGDSDYTFKQFSEDVTKAIIAKFGKDGATPDKKCIKVHSNTCRVDADVVPHFRHKRFHPDGTDVEGVAIRTAESTIYNWPDQDYDNGVEKNEATGKRYKGFVRILKNLRAAMEASGVSSAQFAKSYLLSCLVWNVPNHLFSGDDYGVILDKILVYLINATNDHNTVKEWGEVNELKYLFRSSQPWDLDDVNEFLRDARSFARNL